MYPLSQDYLLEFFPLFFISCQVNTIEVTQCEWVLGLKMQSPLVLTVSAHCNAAIAVAMWNRIIKTNSF